MPRQVDPATRRQVVIQALFRVVVREGLHRASLRSIADEAHLNIGSLRHYFASQQELMRFAMRSVIDQVTGRLRRRAAEMGQLTGLSPEQARRQRADLLAELLPLDDIRRTEVTVFLEFTTAARTDPALDDLAREVATGTRALVRRVLTGAHQRDVLRADLDLDVETERLTALLDGLSIDAVLHPDLLGPQDCITILRTHLEALEQRDDQ